MFVVLPPASATCPPIFIDYVVVCSEGWKSSNPLDYGSLKVQLVRSLDEVRNKRRFLTKSRRLPLVRDAEAAADARLLLCSQQHVEGTPCGDSTEKPPLYR